MVHDCIIPTNGGGISLILWWLHQKVYAVIASVKTNDALEPLNDGPAFAVTSSTVTSWTMAYSLLSALWAPIS